MTIAIHQPNFCPWYPFFQKIEQADVFVLMGNCQFEKNNFQNRFNYNDKWYTMRVFSGLTTLIKDKKYINPDYDWKKIRKSFPKLELFDPCISENVFNTNSFIIKEACYKLGINTPIELDYPTKLKGTERLIDICKTYNVDTYLSGISGKKYLDLLKFEEAGIKVIFQDESKMIKKPLVDVL